MESNARNCLVLGATVPPGFKKKDKKIVLDESVAPSMKWAFESFASGKSMKQIITELNRRGITTSRGTKINHNNLRGILGNRKYCGDYIAMGITVENGIPAIVSREVFNAVQDRLSHPERIYRYKTVYLLSGKIQCGNAVVIIRRNQGPGNPEKFTATMDAKPDAETVKSQKMSLKISSTIRR